ncbi:MAG: Z1 domain-containing protein [Dehalococcoidia bacterium]
MVFDSMGLSPALDQDANKWIVAVDGEEISNLASKKIGEIPQDEWDQVKYTAVDILSQCPNPAGSPKQVTGLALGKVQSGKTLSYTTLIALGLDNGYRIMVVLAGTKNPLLQQNYTRLCSDLGTVQRPSLTPFKNPRPDESEVVENVLLGGGHALIVVLKNRQRIDEARQVLDTPELRNFPALIIDDEGDEASLNTQFRRGRRSAVYDSVLQLKNVFQHHAYIAYTATPQANLLISGIDGLSPDFGELVQPGEDYCGGSTFFGVDRGRYVRDVPVTEADNALAGSIQCGLRQALAAFLVGAAVRKVRGDLDWHSMLIHNSNLRADHETLKSAVQNLVGLWRETLALQETDPAAGDLFALFREAYDDISATVSNPPSWDEIRSRVADESRLEIWMVNSLQLGRDPVGTPFRLKNNVLIGGNMLGRGVTIPGLAVTYITRRAQRDTNADTMEQRARWFGYKRPYLDVCRIFLTPQLRDDYTELLRSEDDFWDSLTRNRRQGLSIREWPRMLRLDMQNLGIRPTRQSVANFRQFKASGWEIQRRPVENDPLIAEKNVRAINGFFREYPPSPKRYGHVEHRVIASCPVDNVISELLAPLQTEGTDWENSYQIEYLARLLLEKRLETIDVLLMAADEGGFRKRTKSKTSGGINPMQGHDTHRPSSHPDFYPGDEQIHDGQPQLQVHLIRLEDPELPTSVKTHVLALYMPSNAPNLDLEFVVRMEHR